MTPDRSAGAEGKGSQRGLLQRTVDTALELPIAPSFTRIGYRLRSRTEGWRELSSYDLTGRTVLITGATSGLGRAAATTLARQGASLVLVGRDPSRTAAVAEDLDALGPGTAAAVVADMGDLDAVRAAAHEVARDHPQVDTLVHNAGALSAQRQISPDRVEMTVASQVVGPFLMTSILLETLVRNRPARVITMASGGMYGAGLTVEGLQMDAASYNGTMQYALAKRAQVTLNEMWAQRHDPDEVVFHAMHPGWADTPGVQTSLPTFRRVTGPLLRSVEQGADTLVWLIADDEALATSGDFWHDRRRRDIHRTPSSRRSDTPAARRALWAWVSQTAGDYSPA
jgi:dehydrogenase/reductase SDR family protein 12